MFAEEEEEEIKLIRKPREEVDEPHTTISHSSEEKKEIIRHNLDDPAPETTDYSSPKKVSAPVDETDKENVFEFVVREPEASTELEEVLETDTMLQEEKESLERKAKERIERLRQMSIKLKAPGGLDELENEPAYRRKNVPLSDAKPSEDSKISKYTLSEGDDDDAELKSDNSFLHDNVD
jgi:cell division protein FtsZ